MTTTLLSPADPNAWINSFDPKKRVFTGRSYLILKRIMDLTLVLFSAPLWLPLLGAIALLIRVTSPGAPALFTQYRTGKGGKRFRMYKFRTMVPDAEKQGGSCTADNDPRLTGIGQIAPCAHLAPCLGESLANIHAELALEVASFEPAAWKKGQTPDQRRHEHNDAAGPFQEIQYPLPDREADGPRIG